MRLFPRLFSNPQRPGGLLFALLCLALAGVGSVEAATLVVTTTADSGVGSLRQALADASHGDTIEFDAGLNGQTIIITEELLINKDITINGPGPDLLTVRKGFSPSPYITILHITPSRTVTIRGITVSRGYYGGIFNEEATLTLDNCAVRDNFCDCFSGGGIDNYGGTLTILNSVIANNTAGYVGAFPTGYGGGISTGGSLTIRNSVVTGKRGTSPAAAFTAAARLPSSTAPSATT